MNKTKNPHRNQGCDIKIILVGNSNSGKTSIANRWTKDQFSPFYKATIASEFSYKLFEHEGIYYKIHLWDLAGQDKSIKVTRVFCNDAHGVIVVSDITKMSNLKDLKDTLEWKNSISEVSKFMDGSDLPMILLENKVDLIEEDNSDININDMIKSGELCSKNDFLAIYRTSAKKNININESITFLIKYIIEKLEKISQDEMNEIKNKKNEKISIGYGRSSSFVSIKEKKSGGCC